MASTPPRSPYNKPPLAPHDLLAHLVSRGLSVPSPAEATAALAVLERIDYYRLLSYMRPLQQTDPSTQKRHFLPGTTLADVLELYEFDRKLRLLCMDAVERIEVALRAAIVSEVAVAHGAHFYLDASHFVSIDTCHKFQEAVSEEARRHPGIKHYHQRYDSPSMPPIWVAMEAVTFGTLSHLYSNLVRPRRRAIAVRFGYDEAVLRSWFRALSTVRNISAHHGRLWNATLSADKPMPAKVVAAEFGFTVDTFFARAVVIAALLDRVAPDAEWKAQLRTLLDSHSRVDERRMGFQPGWRDRPFWTT